MKTLLAFAALSFVSVPAMAQTTTTVSNTTPIAVCDGCETTSVIVSGLAGNITNLTLSLNGLSHTYPDDLVFGLLNDDTGIGFVFMSGAGGSTAVSNVNLTFSDAASDQLPESFGGGGAITSGTWLPSNFGQYEFTSFTNVDSFAGFNGLSANGSWTLYIDDVFPADGGSVNGGWALTFTTDAGGTGAVPEPATWAMMIAGFGMIGAGMRRQRKTKVVFA